jgi:mono/diheme cytochrome c family protein
MNSSMPKAVGVVAALYALLCVRVPTAATQDQTPAGTRPVGSGAPAAGPTTGKAVFQAACAACHGGDGTGTPQTTAGFTPPDTFPDFTDCNATSREPNDFWKAIVHGGGPARGFSEIMPAFEESLSSAEIDSVVQYLRGVCREPSWPRGELNLPRPLVTDKAFPEDETVVTTSINARGGAAVSNVLVYERRIGVRNQIELVVPFRFQRHESRTWYGGVGDVTVGYKRVLFSSLPPSSIFSLSGEAVLPTGNTARGLGSGFTTLETFATYGQLLPRNAFLQFQGGIEIPTERKQASNAVFWRGVAGKGITESRGMGRLWAPMIEILADRELATGESVNWDAIPQFQVTLNRRQHLRANFGVRFPLNNTAGRATQIMFYLLWDRFDGGVRDGW